MVGWYLFPFQALATLAGPAPQFLLAREGRPDAGQVAAALQGFGSLKEFSSSTGFFALAGHVGDGTGFGELAGISSGAGDLFGLVVVGSEDGSDAGSFSDTVDDLGVLEHSVFQRGRAGVFAETGDAVDALEGCALAGLFDETADLVKVVELAGVGEARSGAGLVVNAFDVAAIFEVHAGTVDALDATEAAGVRGYDPAFLDGRYHIENLVLLALAGDLAPGSKVGRCRRNAGSDAGHGSDRRGDSGV